MPPQEGRSRWGWARAGMVAVAVAVAWVAGTLELAHRLPSLRPSRVVGLPSMAFPWMRWVPAAVAAGWGVVGLVVLARWWRRGRRRDALGAMLLGLSGSAALAAALSAAQLLPVFEFIGQTSRAAGEGAYDIYPFSLEPIRLIELAWPNVFGTRLAGNRSWLEATRPPWSNARVWLPSLYLGGLSLVLALGAMGFRGHPARGWMTAVAVVSLLASLGEYTGPLWWARWAPSIAERVGPHDPMGVAPIRFDGHLRDGDGGLYWAMATALPGFRQFRYPSKLLSFTTLALAVLAGLGWDRLTVGLGRRRTAAAAAALLAIGLVALAATTLRHDRIVAAFRSNPDLTTGTEVGPLDAEGAFVLMQRGLAHGSVVFAASLALAVMASRRPATAGALALVVMTADLIVANAGLVLTVPQALLDAESKVVRIIRDAERVASARGEAEPGPFRVHRMPYWRPLAWSRESRGDRISDYVSWERDTIQAKYGVMDGIEYTLTLGVAEVYDYTWFFGPFNRRVSGEAARQLGVPPGRPVVVFTRRSFDMWNSRYFVVPAHPKGWNDASRGYASFQGDAEPIYPPPDAFLGPGGEGRRRDWVEREDFQVFRNLKAYPRAWVVHEGRFVRPFEALGRAERNAAMQEILYDAGPLWTEPGRAVFDPRQVAWLDDVARPALSPYLPGKPPLPSEAPRIVRYEPQRVEIDVTLERPGLVVLADIFYPGWSLTIDGQDAPIYRVNRAMRGAAVRDGRHRLVFAYRPRSFRDGVIISLAGLAALTVLAVAVAARPGSRPDPGALAI
jgi:hypothetical protein